MDYKRLYYIPHEGESFPPVEFSLAYKAAPLSQKLLDAGVEETIELEKEIQISELFIPAILCEYDLPLFNLAAISTLTEAQSLGVLQLQHDEDNDLEEHIDLTKPFQLIIDYPFNSFDFAIYKVLPRTSPCRYTLGDLIWIHSKIVDHLYKNDIEEHQPHIGFGSLTYEGIIFHKNNTVSFSLAS